jgi:hypothetical protein
MAFRTPSKPDRTDRIHLVKEGARLPGAMEADNAATPNVGSSMRQWGSSPTLDPLKERKLLLVGGVDQSHTNNDPWR